MSIIEIISLIFCGIVSGGVIAILSEIYCSDVETHNNTPHTSDTKKALRHKILKQLQDTPKQYSLILLSTIAYGFLAYDNFPSTLPFIFCLGFGYLLILLSAIDFRTQLLPNIYTFPLIGLGLLQAYLEIFTPFTPAIIGAVAGYGLFWSVNTLFRLLRNKEGMGYGDFKLMAALGAWNGYMMIPLILIIAPLLGISFAIFRTLTTGADIRAPFPFGPALAAGGLIAFFFGNQILIYYLQLLTLN